MNFIPQMEPWFDANEKIAINNYMDENGWLTEFKHTKDFEDRIAGVEGAANSAKKATNSLRAEIEGKFQSVEELNNKMTSVEEILSSANFKIATTNDSLKLTQTSIDEFRVETEAKLKTLAKADEQFTYAYAGIGLALVLVIVVFVVMNSKINAMKAIIAAQEEVLNKKIHDEMHHAQTKLSRDISHAKSDMNHKFDAEKAAGYELSAVHAVKVCHRKSVVLFPIMIHLNIGTEIITRIIVSQH